MGRHEFKINIADLESERRNRAIAVPSNMLEHLSANRHDAFAHIRAGKLWGPRMHFVETESERGAGEWERVW